VEIIMNNRRRSAHPYRVSGANGVSGKDLAMTVDAFDEADAARMANRQGIFVSSCVAVAARGASAQLVANDSVVQRLLEDLRRQAAADR
jgi:hypothetical protein